MLSGVFNNYLDISLTNCVLHFPITNVEKLITKLTTGSKSCVEKRKYC